MEYTNRIDKTIIISVCWLAFTILSIAFNPMKLGLWQNLATITVSGVLAVGSIALTWIKNVSC